MGLFDKAASKIKSMFVEDLPEEKVEIKKEVIKVEIPAPEEEIVKIEKEEPKFEDIKPKVEEVKPEPTIEPKKEESFKFPVYFDEKDFNKIEEETKYEPSYKEEPVRTSFRREDVNRYQEKEEPTPTFRDAYGKQKVEKPRDFASAYKKEEPKKAFKPTPIISPVYGILDKNYTKEDITTKRPTRLSSEINTDKVTIDDVRKKAYGTLEDDIETTLFGDDDININSEELFDDIELENKASIEADELLNSFDDLYEDTSLEDNVVEETLSRDYDSLEEESKKRSKSKPVEVEDEEDIDMTESDLFNLIDSWYEKRDEE